MANESLLLIEGLSVEVLGRPVLSGINLEVKKGQRLALLGPNGSGKTSLIMAIMGFSDYKVTKGEIIFKGKRINSLSIDERSRLGIGIMMQRPPTIRGVKLRQIIEKTRSKGFDIGSESRGAVLEEFLNRDLNLGFSGGEIKRCELLQLLSNTPQLGLFDEPESGVDLENVAVVGRLMNRILDNNKDNAALIITHTGYIFDYVKADRGCILVGGRLHCMGDPKRILQTIKKRGYEWCITCMGEKMKEKSHSLRR